MTGPGHKAGDADATGDLRLRNEWETGVFFVDETRLTFRALSRLLRTSPASEWRLVCLEEVAARRADGMAYFSRAPRRDSAKRYESVQSI